MPKRPTGYYRPKHLDQALELIARPDTLILGGGTKLLAGDVEGAVVDLQDIGLNAINFEKDTLVAGAMTRLNELAASISESLPPGRDDGLLDRSGLLGRAIRLSGPNTYRNAATIGGTIASRIPDSELLAALLVFEATLTIQDPDEKTMSLKDYLDAETRPEGLITEISFNWCEGAGSGYRVARTPADQPIVSVTAWKPENGPILLATTGIELRPVLYPFTVSGSQKMNDDAVETFAEKIKLMKIILILFQ